jgi:DNA/RNA-binding domain of Phe-tRNA-synthetase-like protein
LPREHQGGEVGVLGPTLRECVGRLDYTAGDRQSDEESKDEDGTQHGEEAVPIPEPLRVPNTARVSQPSGVTAAVAWAAMEPFPPSVRHELDGWRLFWADLELVDHDAAQLAPLREDVAERARSTYLLAGLAEHPTVAALRRLFRQAGCDPTRYRPASEALLRRLLKGEGLPAIHPLVDLNNCLSAELAVPVCVMDRDALRPPFVWRAGRPGESYASLKGPFNLEGKPLLLDEAGPCDAPITGGERVKVRESTRRAWLVAYLPAEVIDDEEVGRALRALVRVAPVALIHATGFTPAG